MSTILDKHEYPWTLKEFLREVAVVRQKVVLASGQVSDYYIDCRRAILHPVGARLIRDALFNTLQRFADVTQVGGLATGAIPLVCALSRYYEGFYVRRETKDYGLSQTIEGSYDSQEPAAILEDVVTTGDSVQRVIRILEENLTPIKVIISLVDRNPEQTRFDYPYVYLFSAKELLE